MKDTNLFMDFLRKLFGAKKKIFHDEARKFEIYVGRYFSNSGDFVVLRTPSQRIDGMKSKQDNLPDYQFEDKRSGKRFLVECKWRPDWIYINGEKTVLFNSNHINLYKKTQMGCGERVFIALGVGKSENILETEEELYPREFYFFPIGMFAGKDYIRQKYLLKNNRMHQFKYKHPKYFPDTGDLK